MSLDAGPNQALTEADVLASFPALPELMQTPEVVSQAAVFRIYPNQRQKEAFRQWIGAGRWVWNRCVEINQHLYDVEKRFAFHGELSSLLPQMKKANGLEWLAQPPAIHLVDICRRYDTALNKFLADRRKVRAGEMKQKKAAGFPKFKKKRDRQGSIYLAPSCINLIRREATPTSARGWVELPNMDQTEVWRKEVKRGPRKGQYNYSERKRRYSIRIRGSRWPEGKIRSATIRENGPDIWVMSVQFDAPPPKLRRRGEDIPVPEPEVAARGYDLGLSAAVIGSDGEKVAPGRHLRKSLKKLRRIQRKSARRRQRRLELSTKQAARLPRSKGERLAYEQEARVHRQVRHARTDFLHKITSRAIAKSVVICAEDLNVSGMKQNSKLALSISDAGMGELLRQLDYKASWSGRHFVKVDRWAPSSKTCSACDHKLDELSLKTRRWTCPSCGCEHDRDENAALNILRWGLEEALRRGTPEVTSGESRALARGKGLRRNSARKALEERTGNIDTDEMSCLNTLAPHDSVQ